MNFKFRVFKKSLNRINRINLKPKNKCKKNKVSEQCISKNTNIL